MPVYGDAFLLSEDDLGIEPNINTMKESEFMCKPNWDNLDIKCLIEYDPEEEREFCHNWGCARRALVAMCRLIKNPFIKCVINCTLKLGDALHKKICPQIPEKPQK